MIKYGINNYNDINPENIKIMTEKFNIENFFSDSYNGIAAIIITPLQYAAIYTQGDCSLIYHDQLIEQCLQYMNKEYKNPRIIIELTHAELDQSIVQLPGGRRNPITNEMNRLKLYFDDVIRYYQPKDILSECSNDYLFVKKCDKINCDKEALVGMSLDKACKKMREECVKIHKEKRPKLYDEDKKTDTSMEKE